MEYTFTGGPLNGQTLEVPDDRIVDGSYNHVTFGEYKNPFHLLPETFWHRYLPVNNEMVYCQPDKIA